MIHVLQDCLETGNTSAFLKSSKDAVIPISTVYTPLSIPKCLPDEFRPSAVSVVSYPFANVRHVNYLQPFDGTYRTRDGGPIQTHNLYVNLETGEHVSTMDDSTVSIPRNPARVKGLEDIRLFTRDGRTRFIATSYNEFCPSIGMITGEYNSEAGTYSSVQHLPSPILAQCEKNWLPISNTRTFIYSWNPFRLIEETNGSAQIIQTYTTPALFKLFSGSAPPIFVNGKFICMIHFINHYPSRKYYHMFVELDSVTYVPIRISVPFIFKTQSIEYCVGFRQMDADTLECFPSFMDGSPSRTTIPIDSIEWVDVECTQQCNPKIGLCMIVKNESHIIRESLTATLPLIDTYCIVDTGSTDDTIDVIKTFYTEHGISGEVHERPWKNFGHNRSDALTLCDGKMDYILVIDADDLIAWQGNGKEDLLAILRIDPNMVNFKIRQGDLVYSRMQVFKARDGWKYVGVLHEYPTNNKPNNKVVPAPPTMYMTSRRLGDRSKAPDKMKRDIAVFLEGLKEEPDNERYMFYLAQSYRDDGQIDKAVEWYTKRYEVGRWYEEQYMSAYNIAKLTHSKEWAWKAHECNPKRIECLVSYLGYCRATNKFSKEVLAMAMYASTIPNPTDQHLFVETDVYEWKVWDELSIIAFYCGRKDIAKRASEKLLAENKAPPHQIERIKANYKFAC